MANYACVAIGINRYQFLPPLNYAQADAQALRQFLVNQANLPSSQCLLLTDTSPLISNQSTYPSRDHIQHWLEASSSSFYRDRTNRTTTRWHWFFFSGYGVSWENIDYLMPIDGDLTDIPGTGIPVRSLFTSLKKQAGDNLLVMLDINRSPGLQVGTSVGTETVELAHEMGIALVLSSQLNEFSHEAAGLRNGLFTAALLEALHYYHSDITLEHLEQYLNTRLPELCQHHWRPIQTPLIVIPSEAARQQLILPSIKIPLSNSKTPVGVSSAYIPTTSLDGQEIVRENSANGTAASVQGIPLSAGQRRPITDLNSTAPVPSNQAVSRPGVLVHYPEKQPKAHPDKTPWWQKLLLWGGSAALILALAIVAIALRNRDASVSQQAIETPTASPALPPPVVTTDPVSTPSPVLNRQQPTASPRQPASSRLQANQAALTQARRLIRQNQASLFNKAIVETRKIQPGDPLYAQARQNITRWSGVILDIAEGRAEQGKFGAAIAAAQLVPKDDPAAHAKAQQMINQWKTLSTQQQQNQAIIQAARQQVRPNQASSYLQAIMTLRKIPSGQPEYAAAQQLIAQGSQKIYLMANTRASQGKFQEAIQTAALVPAGTPSHGAAQKAIAKWKQGKQPQQNPVTIQAAKQQIQPNQASSYHRGILMLQKIPSNQPEYSQAQPLIAQWGRSIYLLANSRASKGNFAAAIQTAALVPVGTPSHSAAQKAIAKWKQGQR